MFVQLLKSKLHRARVTDANLDYEGSLTIDPDLMDQVELLPHENILCTNATSGARFETYAIPGNRGSGDIILNGAAAHLGNPGDKLTIMSFVGFDIREAPRWKPRIAILGNENLVASRPRPELKGPAQAPS
jgi:aspartate 1-decarboxylase